MGKQMTAQERVHGQVWGRARAPPPARPHPPASTTRGAHNASLTVSTPPINEEPLMGHTHTTVGGDPRRTQG